MEICGDGTQLNNLFINSKKQDFNSACSFYFVFRPMSNLKIQFSLVRRAVTIIIEDKDDDS
jgi:hypothetical protein